jgi:hypothetical protein
MKLLSFCALSLAAAISVLASTTTDVAPIDLSSLADGCTPEVYTDAGTIEAIRNTLAIYPFAIDGKNFDALSKVFTTNAVANYSAPLNVLTPLSSIQSVLETSLACVTTQHLLGTQWIDILSPITARSVTYFRAAHFGKGQTEGQVLYAYGQYQDNWERQSSGTWRIAHRNLVYMVRLAPCQLPLMEILTKSKCRAPRSATRPSFCVSWTWTFNRGLVLIFSRSSVTYNSILFVRSLSLW